MDARTKIVRIVNEDKESKTSYQYQKTIFKQHLKGEYLTTVIGCRVHTSSFEHLDGVRRSVHGRVSRLEILEHVPPLL